MQAGGSKSSRLRLVVEDAGGARIDRYLARVLPDLSRTRLASLIRAGNVLRNGAPARKSEIVVDGDTIQVEIPPARPSHLEAEPMPLDIAFEDEDLLVVNKPAGLVVHPAPGHASGTLLHGLLHHVPDLPGIGGVARPGIVHRLDRDTSGLMLVAKTESAHRALSRALKRREIRRIYQAASWGHVREDELVIDAPIGRSPSDRKRMAVVPGGRRALTRVTRIERWAAADFLRIRLGTGRTHQIRVHLASIGHPIVGDRTYGRGGARGVSGPDRPWADELERRTPRQFLHAAELAFVHPSSGKTVELSSPLPADLAETAAWARCRR